jgi:hypothetical protein
MLISFAIVGSRGMVGCGREQQTLNRAGQLPCHRSKMLIVSFDIPNEITLRVQIVLLSDSETAITVFDLWQENIMW